MKNYIDKNATRIVHVDMDAFYAAVEVRDNPGLAGKPLIIGALPSERGVVATCSYEARVFGVRSAMSIKEAYRRCPDGIYMRPNFQKYMDASRQVHKIWDDYTDICEHISLDEGFLDVTGSAHLFGGADAVGYDIKSRTRNEVGLTCSVGIGYSMMSAKLASEEKKPDGFFEILTPADLRDLIIDRSVRIIYGVGAKTAEELQKKGITTVRHILENRQKIIDLLGKQGRQILDLADGVDNRKVTPYSDPKSIGSEHTFQQDIRDFCYLQDVLLLIAQKLSFDIRLKGLFCRTVTLKTTYADMKQITRSKSGDSTDKARDIYKTASAMLDKIEKHPVRLIGISLSGLTTEPNLQLTMFETGNGEQQRKLDDAMMRLQLKYGHGIVKTVNELRAEKRISEDS
ncbi:MAG: DNA polymerase IV [Defluviitaleaceae bacterium]|nr:DNA polymerase IV [Defluviitaleaceae bacterium]